MRCIVKQKVTHLFFGEGVVKSVRKESYIITFTEEGEKKDREIDKRYKNLKAQNHIWKPEELEEANQYKIKQAEKRENVKGSFRHWLEMWF